MKKAKHISLCLLWCAIICSELVINAHSQSYSKRKSIFLTEEEKTRLQNISSTSPTAALLSAMQARVQKRAASVSFSDPSTTNQWWHHAGEYLTDAALIHAVRPSEEADAWLRASILTLIRRPVADWSGPAFRNYNGGIMTGALETAHLAWGIGIAFDLGQDLFTESEKTEILETLYEKGLEPCRRYLDRTGSFNNWNIVLLAGYTVSAAILGDKEAIAYAKEWIPIACDHFQKDGSYGESLQYANYAAYSLTLAHETLLRLFPPMSTSFSPYGRMAEWASQALFYRKPLQGWPLNNWPRSANFGDAAAIFRPSGDFLVHIAVRAKNELPLHAGLASWLFSSLYFPANELGPHDLASFGFVNDFGFLSVIMLEDAAPGISPVEAGLPLTAAFSSGDAFARDSWDGKTVLAARIPSEPRYASAHLHGDINAFILVHNNERLIVDPGHSCYRNIWRELEVSSGTHSTCTFRVPATENKPSRQLTQHTGRGRKLLHENGKLKAGEPADQGGKRLIAARDGEVSVIGADAADFYGEPILAFNRFWILCGSNALFIVDQIESDVPVSATWNFMLNNRDGLLDLKINQSDNLLARRGDAGVMIKHYGNGQMRGPMYSLVHDAYHPLPAQRGEGRPGSGMMMQWSENTPSASRTVVYTLAIDSHAGVLGWESKGDESIWELESQDQTQKWSLQIISNDSFQVMNKISGLSYSINRNKEGIWKLSSGVQKNKK